MEHERKKTEAAAEDVENEDLGATGVIGATEDDSTSTISEDGARNEDNSLILEEREIVVDEGENTEAAVASDECGDSRAIEENTKSSGAPPARFQEQGK